jgi:hypothetical protein
MACGGLSGTRSSANPSPLLWLHGDQDEAAEKGVLTGEAVGAVATDGIEGGNDSQVGEGARSSAS